MSACPSPVAIGFIRTQRSRPPKSFRPSHSLTTPRVAALRSGATASSRSRMRPSAGNVRALASIRSLPPGTKWSDRRRRATPQALRLRIIALRRRVKVHVQGLRVHREAGEPHVVRLGDRASGLVPEGLSDLELLEVFTGHENTSRRCRASRLDSDRARFYQ